MACMLAESPSDPFHQKLRPLRRLSRRFDCYRVERTSSRAGVTPAEVQRLSRRTIASTMCNRHGSGFDVSVRSVLRLTQLREECLHGTQAFRFVREKDK